jgi:hypothetical protein
MDVEVPLAISKKEMKSHMKKVTYDILEQQWKYKLELQEAGLVNNSQYSVEE